MKYRFRKADTKRVSRKPEGKRLRFAGARTLSLLRPLPAPLEGIRISDDDFAVKKKKRIRPRLRIAPFFAQLYRELSAAARRLFRFVSTQSRHLGRWVAAYLSKERKKTINSLPLLFGAAIASLLVCTVTASYVALWLFAPYAASYDTVTVPALQGLRLDEIELSDGRFNLLVQYESNPEVESGRIISQSPAAGVTRKIYEKNGFCDLRVTVSKQVSPTVPDGLVGSSLRDASLSLLNSGLSYTVTEEYSQYKKGSVIRAYPAEGASVPEGGSVLLTVSLGQKISLSSVPSLSGLSESEALLRIRSSGLSVGSITYVRSGKKAGTVVSQEPSAHSSVSPDTAVSFTVSAGEDFHTLSVPDLYGMSVEEAEAALRSVGLTVSSVYSVASAAKSGTVISQSPLPNTVITSAITSVELHISN